VYAAIRSGRARHDREATRLEDSPHEVGQIMASDALADALAYLLSRHLRGVDRRLDVDRVFAPGFGRRLWASSIARGRSQDPLLGLIPADSSNRQEGSKREEQILVEAVPREIRPE